MEKGQMRCEANISRQAAGTWEYKNGAISPKKKNHKLNAKVEVKNINSFRAMERAINFEISRQTELLNKGEKIVAETRGWNEDKAETFSQRIKETSADYRYFPEPDIPPLKIDEDLLARLHAALPEMPGDKKRRFMREYGWAPDIAEILVSDKALAAWTEDVVSELEAWIEANGDEAARQEKRLAKTAAFWITGELWKHLKVDNKKIGDLKMTAENFAELICLMYQGKINASAGQRILEKMYWEGGDPTDIMTALGLEQMDDSAELEAIVKKIIAASAGQVAQYRAGKTNVFQFFVGQVMAASGGKANPKIVKELLEKLLK
jgi:aspartyl-tRNA(Asn)/glutamyl-tRNA(Gln) amidotransferase subunit B